jgi:nitrate reductase NapE component
LKELEQKNAKLKKLVAELSLDKRCAIFEPITGVFLILVLVLWRFAAVAVVFAFVRGKEKR